MPQDRLPYNKLSKTGKHYRDNPTSCKKQRAKDSSRSKSEEGLKYRATHKRMRRVAEKIYGKLGIKGKDIEKSTGKPVSIKVNRGRLEKSRLKGSKRK